MLSEGVGGQEGLRDCATDAQQSSRVLVGQQEVQERADGIESCEVESVSRLDS